MVNLMMCINWSKFLIPLTKDAMFKWSRVMVTVSNRMNGSANESGFLRPARIPYKVVYSLLFTLIIVIIVLLLPSKITRKQALLERSSNNIQIIKEDPLLYGYNATYPFTTPISKLEIPNRVRGVGLSPCRNP